MGAQPANPLAYPGRNETGCRMRPRSDHELRRARPHADAGPRAQPRTAAGYEAREFEEDFAHATSIDVRYALQPKGPTPFQTIVRSERERTELNRVSLRAAELRLNSARLHGFADISSVEAFLDELAANDPPRVVKLGRTPGERENRWTHLLCGEVSASELAQPGVEDDAVPLSAFEAVKAEQKRLADEVSRLQAVVRRMAAELGIDIEDL